MKAFPGFMGEKPERLQGSVTGEPDVKVGIDNRIEIDLGLKSTYPDPRFRMINVAGELIWFDNDQKYVFEEEVNGEPHLFLRMTENAVLVPVTGAVLHVRAGGVDREYHLIRSSSPFED